jgi:hypothetical protein
MRGGDGVKDDAFDEDVARLLHITADAAAAASPPPAVHRVVAGGGDIHRRRTPMGVAVAAVVIAILAALGLGTTGQGHLPPAAPTAAPSPTSVIHDGSLEDGRVASSPPAPAVRAEPVLPRHLPRTPPTTSVRAGGFYFI